MKLILVLVICLCLCVSGREKRCSLPPDRGLLCRGYFVHHHFNPTSQRCEEFVYGGCKGNGNNFKTLEECQQVCDALTEVISQSPEAGESVITPPLGASNHGIKQPPVVPNSLPEVNSNQSETSKSDGDLSTDASAGAVKSPPARSPEQPSVFSIEPLDGRKPGKEDPLDDKEANLVLEDVDDIPGEPSKNGQSHGDLQDGKSQGNLQDAQSQSTHKDNTANDAPAADVLTDGKGPAAPDSVQAQPPPSGENALPDCSSPAEPGPCQGLFPRFNYNRDRGTCKEFTYGGCAGNLNRYKTNEECETRCLQAPAKPKEPAKKTTSVLTTDGHVHTVSVKTKSPADKVTSSTGSSVSHTGSSGEHVK